MGIRFRFRLGFRSRERATNRDADRKDERVQEEIVSFLVYLGNELINGFAKLKRNSHEPRKRDVKR